MRAARVAWIVTAAFALLTAATAPAGAAPTAREKAEAKRLSSEAQAAFKLRRYEAAAASYRRADELNPSAQRKIGLARALVGAGRLLEASMVLHSVEEAPARSPEAKKAQRTAARLQRKLEPRIPWLQVVVTGPPPSAVRTLVDQQEFNVTSEVPLDPGEHVIAVEAPGFQRAERRLILLEGKHEKLTIALDSSTRRHEDKVSEPAKPAAFASKGGSKLPAAIAFGVGAAGLGVGTVFGLLAVRDTSEAKAGCSGNVCPYEPEVVSARNAAIRNGNISTAAFIVGGVGVATGVVLLIVSRGPREPPDSRAKSAFIHPWLGLRQAGVAGAF